MICHRVLRNNTFDSVPLPELVSRLLFQKYSAKVEINLSA